MVFGRIPRRRVVRKRRAGPKKRNARKGVRRAGVKSNTASLTENYQVSAPDGVVIFNRQVRLADATFDRAQAVAQAYQEFCIKSITLTFRPSADTFAPVAGNSLPQLYYLLDKAGAVPTNANLQTMLDMGVRPLRFDARNIVKSYKPSALLGADSDTLGTITAGMMSKSSPWLATNSSAGAPGPGWSPSTIEHTGCAFFVTKMSGLTPPLNYTIDASVVFNFRKPLWRAGAAAENNNMNLAGDALTLINH